MIYVRVCLHHSPILSSLQSSFLLLQFCCVPFSIAGKLKLSLPHHLSLASGESTASTLALVSTLVGLGLGQHCVQIKET